MKNHYIVTLHVSTDMEDFVGDDGTKISGFEQALHVAEFERSDVLKVDGIWSETKINVPANYSNAKLFSAIEKALKVHAADLLAR